VAAFGPIGCCGQAKSGQPSSFPVVITPKKVDDMEGNRVKLWLKRVGVAGFLFFLIKGLIWIAIFVGLGKCAF